MCGGGGDGGGDEGNKQCERALGEGKGGGVQARGKSYATRRSVNRASTSDGRGGEECGVVSDVLMVVVVAVLSG